ncbi:MAG TPA: alpha/beta hydrolase, partial [Candidatus Limnocylindrales bacterium]|nr:alpha/beta hydrolase [Candidatus Limnocylindrales bacterium]
ARHVETLPQSTPTGASDRVITLADGRHLGYHEIGDPHGRPVFFFHGFGTSRVICPPDEQTALGMGVRLIAVDRPGIGLSDAKPGRSLLDWPQDVATLADRLGIVTFSVIGWSGGGPYALACASALPDRVAAIGLVSSPAPLAGIAERGYLRRLDRNAVRAAGRAPVLIRLALWHWGRPQRRDAERFFEESVAEMCAADQAILSDTALRERMIANSTELYRQGGRGMYDEALVLARPWGFELSDITVPVYLWHGERDETVPLGMATYLARAIPTATVTFDSDEGHHLLYRRWPEILAALL